MPSTRLVAAGSASDGPHGAGLTDDSSRLAARGSRLAAPRLALGSRLWALGSGLAVAVKQHRVWPRRVAEVAPRPGCVRTGAGVRTARGGATSPAKRTLEEPLGSSVAQLGP